ncbi:hypothetical protein A3844_00680 [Paenibacillus helianthi]|uniref:Aminoglycoside phosphotransferase domain-containing protein n=1 Tax=Paenibacillus helianthi TaxID=1349432 RepID=A0ABX3EXT6_9BACL|nr:phosphotransferase [Paenibacillus helianthi]OKP91675.1 hypothetical protein A3844_00680 [Paenibacillus helianthi]
MDNDALIQEINRSYPLEILHIEFHREMIGRVYFLRSRHHKYVLKMYRSSKKDDVLQTIRILDFLHTNSYPVATIVRKNDNSSYFSLSCQENWNIAIIYDYEEGTMPDGKIEAEHIGQQIGELHQVMKRYPHKLINRTKNEYINDYITIMGEMDWDSEKIQELKLYGDELWKRISKLPTSFCHGDLHTGNMIRNQSGEYVLLDWDDASGDYPSMDVAYMSDDTHFNEFHPSMYDRTMRLFERFYSGYSRTCSLSGNECNAIFDFIAVRHFQIISRIVRSQGLSSISIAFCEEQYNWLTKWQKLCLRGAANR